MDHDQMDSSGRGGGGCCQCRCDGEDAMSVEQCRPVRTPGDYYYFNDKKAQCDEVWSQWHNWSWTWLRKGPSTTLCSWIIVTCLVLMLSTSSAGSIGHTGDGCDWLGSGLENPSGRGVQPAYLRCNQGHVKWLYPRGGLRIILRTQRVDRDFRGCIKIDPGFEGARIFLEEPGRLQQLYSVNDGQPAALKRCFRSRQGVAAIYVESAPDVKSYQRQVAAFHYDLQQLAKDAKGAAEEECRPCSDDEMLRAFCTSDFVARGIISSVDNNMELQRTELTVEADKVWRQIFPVFQDKSSRSLIVSGNDLGEDDSSPFTGIVNTPSHCGARQGLGEFVFMGRLRLGEPELTCAPRKEDFEAVVRKAEREGTLQCEVDRDSLEKDL